MINAFEVVINFYQGALIIYFCDKFFVGRRNWTLAVLCTVLAGVFLSVHQIFALPIPDTFVFLIGYLYLFFTKRSNIGGRIFCCVLIAAIWIVCATAFNAIIQYILKADINVLFENEKSRILYLITINALITVLIFAICSLFRKRQTLRIPVSFSLLFITLLSAEWLTTEFLFSYVTHNDAVNSLFVYSIILLFCIIVLSVVLYEGFCKVLNRALFAENAARMLEDSQKHQGEIKNMYRAMLKNQHDFKHRIATVEAVLKMNGELSSEKISELLSEEKYVKNLFLTGNESMDALLTAKRETALSYGITFRYQPYPLTRLPIDEISFCVLISNLLDNAIQELAYTDVNQTERYIDLKLSKSMDMFCISCINPMNTERKDVSSSALIFKQYNGHGYGLESISQMIEKRQGIMQIYSQDYMFRVDIMLPMEDNDCYGD